MVSQEIRNCGIALGALMHQVDPEQAAVLRLVKTNLIAAADTAEELEHSLIVPKPGRNLVEGVKIAATRANIEMVRDIASERLTQIREGSIFADAEDIHYLAKALDHLARATRLDQRAAGNEVKEEIQKVAV
jgi:hypothetical protein